MDAYDIKVPILDMEDIVHKLGGDIEEKEDFNDLFDGSIRKNGEYGFIIAISPFQNDRRKTFVLAHEIGHLFLHMGYLTDREYWKSQSQILYRRFRTAEQTYQANEFAAALLMPESEFKRIFIDYHDGQYVDMNRIAHYFHVSVTAAINRGKSLGYFDV